jgi:hypothetical protein
MNLDVLPLVLMAIGLGGFLFAIKVFFQQRRILEVVPSTNVTIELPEKWDDAQVTRLLQRYHDQPAVLSHAVNSIKARMITGQDIKTAQKRLKLISGVVELFKLNREMQRVLYDIHLSEKDFEITQVERQITLEDAQSRLISERRLRLLRQERERMQLEQEIDTLKQGMNAYKEPKLTADQQRRLKRMEIEDKIKELDRQEQEALKTARSDDDRVRLQNMFDHRREELREQLTKHLV